MHTGHDVDDWFRGKARYSGAADVLNRPDEPRPQGLTEDLCFLSESHRPRRIVRNELDRRFWRSHHGDTANFDCSG
jgi:hypothetical protein